jgi:hypothetical protein
MVTTPKNNLLYESKKGLGINRIKLKWIIGTHGNWKNQNPGVPFWSYQLNSTVNSAHLARFWG